MSTLPFISSNESSDGLGKSPAKSTSECTTILEVFVAQIEEAWLKINSYDVQGRDPVTRLPSMTLSS